MPAKCSKCGGDFKLGFDLPEEITQERVDAMNMVCGECTPKRLKDLRPDEFEKIKRAGNALVRFDWMYRDGYQTDPEMEEIFQRALDAADKLSPYINRIEELDIKRCREIHEMFWPGKNKENQDEVEGHSD